jgi:AcrR family transcriptional regulator
MSALILGSRTMLRCMAPEDLRMASQCRDDGRSLTNGVRHEYCSSMGMRDPFVAREVNSRRGGPRKAPLSRDAIVAEALRQLRRDGLAGMSLRKVATSLETGPASLYAYVDDLRELQALVLDRALSKVAVRGPRRGGWRANLVSLLKSYLEALFDAPGLAELALGTIAVGPNALRITETFLGLLADAGVDRRTAAWAVDLFLLYATAIAAEHGGRDSKQDPSNPAGAVVRAIREISALQYPQIHAAREDLLSGSGGQRVAWAIDVLLRGILPPSRSPAATSPVTPKVSLARKQKRR